MCETVGALLGWISSVLTADPLMLLMCSSFVGSFLQGVAHEITGEKATLPQLEDFADEIGHTTFFPCLLLQSIHHSVTGAMHKVKKKKRLPRKLFFGKCVDKNLSVS